MTSSYLKVFLIGLVTLTACRTTPPRIPDLPPLAKRVQHTNIDVEVAAALGSITVSTPKFTPITTGPADGNKLDFGDFRKIDKLYETIRKANIGVSQAYYQAEGLALAAKLAGTQVTSEDSRTRSSGVSGNADLAALLQQAISGNVDTENLPVQGTGEFSAQRSSSYTESFQSPGAPALPNLPELPEPVLNKLVELLAGSGDAFVLDPFTEVKLVAALHNSMINTEAFYNFDGIFTGTNGAAAHPSTFPGKPAAGGDVWAPYRVQFVATVNPGWYTSLNSFDANIEVNFPSDTTRVMAVVPEEAAQTIDEFTSSLEQFALATSLEGSFKAIGLQAAYNSLSAAARRLEGFRKNTIHLVSYPSVHEANIRMRPTILPNEEFSELHPSQTLFTAFVLVKQTKDEVDMAVPEFPARLLAGSVATPIAVQTQSSLRPASQPSRGPDSIPQPESFRVRDSSAGIHHGLYLPHKINVKYRGSFQAAVFPKVRRGLKGVGKVYVHAPDNSDERSSRYYVSYPARSLTSSGPRPVPQEAWRKLTAPVPPYRSRTFEPFGFVQNPFGFFDVVGSGTKSLTGYIAYSISNPPNDPVSPPPPLQIGIEQGDWTMLPPASSATLWGHTSHVGILEVNLGSVPKNPTGHKARVMLAVRRVNVRGEYETEVREVVLPHRSAVGSGTRPTSVPTVSIDANGVTASKVPIDKLTPELAALITNGHVILKSE